MPSKELTYNEIRLISLVNRLIYLSENEGAQYKDLEQARMLVFSIQNDKIELPKNENLYDKLNQL